MVMNRAHALSRHELIRVLTAYTGVTTADGLADGTTLVDSNLIDNPLISPTGIAEKTILIETGNARGEDKASTLFDNATGTITLQLTGFSAQILQGTIFRIINIRGGGGAPAPLLAPSIGLWMFGECAPGMAASLDTLVIPNLAGFPDDIFNNEFWIQVIHNADVPGTAPERQIRRVTNYVGDSGTFTVDPFLNNVEANDLVAVFHESIMAIEILGFGTLTVDSTTVPADGGRAALYAWENDNYFNGCLLMPTEGDCRFQPRRILDFTRVGGIFTLDPNNPFSQLPGTVDYIIIGDQTEFVPAADGANNRIPSDVIGSKASTAIYAKDAVSDVIRYLKGLMDSQITAYGTADAGSGAGLIRDAVRTEVDDWWNGQTVLMLTGAAAFQKRPITDFLAVTDDIIVAPNFDGAVGAGDIYVILAHYNMIVPRTADDVANALTSQVIGRKDDTAIFSAAFNVSSIIRYLKGLMGTKIEAYGIADAGSGADTLVDAALTQGDDYWNGLTLLMITGANAGLTRPIVDFTDAGDIIEIRPAFPAAIVADDVYVILSNYHEVVPGVDSAENYLPRDVIGNKEDTALTAPTAADSIMRYIKGILSSVAGTTGSTMAGKSQIFEKSITNPANDTDVIVATITTEPCLIESVVIHADTVQPDHMTNCGVFGGAAKVITFIAAADALQADLDAIDKQVFWEGKVRLAATKTIVIDLQGTGTDNVDLTIIVKYRACVSGGYLV